MERGYYEYSLGIDIGGTKISIGLVDHEGTVWDKVEMKTGPDFFYQTVVDKITKGTHTLLKGNACTLDDIGIIGFGIPGTTSSKEGIIEHAPNLSWKKVPFGKAIHKELPARLYFAQETHAAVLAEYLFGAGVGTDNLVCVAIGTGIGCGLILGGKLYRGSFNTAGEFGHLIVEKDGVSCACGKNGCIETYGSGPAIGRRIADRGIEGTRGMDTEELFRLAASGRDEIKDEILKAVEYIGMGLVNVVNLLSPEKILITGGLSEQIELIIEPLKRYVREHGYKVVAEKVSIEPAALGKDAPMIGAAMLHRFIEPYSDIQARN